MKLYSIITVDRTCPNADYASRYRSIPCIDESEALELVMANINMGANSYNIVNKNGHTVVYEYNTYTHEPMAEHYIIDVFHAIGDDEDDDYI